MTQFSIPVFEYHSTRPRQTLSGWPRRFIFNDRQLLAGMVRSILTSNSGKLSRNYMAAIVRPTMQFMLDWRSAPDLRVSSAFQSVLRDFSTTTRIGELAQGVSYAYWKWERGYSWIADFGPWVTGLRPQYTGTQLPDFVMWNPSLNDLAVMESKGTCANQHSAAMSKAIKQCHAAAKHPSFSRGYGSVLTLDVKNPSGVGTLHVRDPEVGGSTPTELMYQIFRRSYASWFDLVGDDGLAGICRQGVSNEFTRSISEDRIANYQRETDGPLRDITASALGFDPNNVRFQIDPVIVKAISNFDYFRGLPWEEHQSRLMHRASEQSKEALYFPDGTSISQG